MLNNSESCTTENPEASIRPYKIALPENKTILKEVV
jgi:hypothetical protein